MLIDLINPLWWLSFFGKSFRWWFACEILSLAAFPICFYILRVLKDKGYGLAKIFGVFFVTWINWYLCTVLSFSFGSVFFAFLIMAGLGFLCFLKMKDRIVHFVKTRWKIIVLYEVIFLLAFLFFVNVRTYTPEAMFDPGRSGAEKMLNCAYLHGLMRTSHFPPKDTWLWGYDNTEVEPENAEDASAVEKKKPFFINYYYFGHLQYATLAKLSRYPARYAFNLGLATVFAFSVIGAFSLGFNITRRLWCGFLAAFMIALFGNIDPLQQMVYRFVSWLPRKGADQGLLEFMFSGDNFKHIFMRVDFWRSSRIVKDTVTEFPYFSAILGDLHPHHMSLPIVLLGMGAGMSFIMSFNYKWNSLIDFFKKYGLLFLLFALAIGGTFAANTWDSIVMGFFGLCVMAYVQYKRFGNSWRAFFYTVISVGLLGAASVLLFMLFRMFFNSPVKNEIKIDSIIPLKFEKIDLIIKSTPSKIRTEFFDYFVMFGLFFIPILVYYVLKTREYFKGKGKAVGFVAVVLALFALVYSRNAWERWLPGFLFCWLILTLIFLLRQKKGRRFNVFLMFCLIASFFSFFIEIFYFNDRMVGSLERYNTVFKIWYPLWSFMAVAAAYSFYRMFLISLKKDAWRSMFFLIGFLLCIIITGMLYPVQSTAVRTQYFFNTDEYKQHPEKAKRTLDATLYIGEDRNYSVQIPTKGRQQVNLKDDLAIINWLRENTEGQPLVLEAIGGCYVPFSRIGTMTGLPTIAGWTHHIAQHRGGNIYEIIGPREKDVNEIYRTRDIEEAKRLLKKYDVKYVVVGSLEREVYQPSQLQKFDEFLKEVEREGDTVLYEVPFTGDINN